ncbi:MAG: hypothetical protein WKF37_20770 [Bryobacteraceae bacterium]
MHRSGKEPLVTIVAAFLLSVLAQGGSMKGILLTHADASGKEMQAAKRRGINSVVLYIDEGQVRETISAAKRIRNHGLELYYWIEIGRNPRMANEHPEWMASLQGHPEWRRFFPDAPFPKEGEVVKNYPWVPVAYKESFDAHLERVKKLLPGRPLPKGVFLNDLQAAPSACGCGNSFCRWTPDYGPVRTATRLGDDAAAQFAAAVQKLLPSAEIIPVWTTECEEHDSVKGGRCAGVPCFPNTCWREYTKQLMPLARESQRLAALVPYKAFDQDLPRYGPTAGWVKSATQSFMPPLRNGRAISASRILAILQGWTSRKTGSRSRSNELVRGAPDTLSLE